MRSSSLVLLLLIGIQAVLKMEGGWHHHHQHQHAATENLEKSATNYQPDPSIPVVDPKLFSKRRYRPSPRVVFSEVAPTHDALEGEGVDVDGIRGTRVRRRAGTHTMHRGEYSVCESINTWVGNMTRATDIKGNEVIVLPNVTINNVVKKQFFYETTCRSPTHRNTGSGNTGRGGKQSSKSGNSGCLGIDSRHWNSYCTNTHIFVSALTLDKDRTAWRFIRINAACVCVLSRKSWAGRGPKH
uniref:Nerve growth factor-related domain-containing protein n=1 Tax=Periophthalmus magnuspinnatus TaxID=409849 RepID=A0A3B3ZLB8_9GOBI